MLGIAYGTVCKGQASEPVTQIENLVAAAKGSTSKAKKSDRATAEEKRSLAAADDDDDDDDDDDEAVAGVGGSLRTRNETLRSTSGQRSSQDATWGLVATLNEAGGAADDVERGDGVSSMPRRGATVANEMD